MPILDVDQWTAICVGRLSDMVPLGRRTMFGLWLIANVLYEENPHRDPIEAASDWYSRAGFPRWV